MKLDPVLFEETIISLEGHMLFIPSSVFFHLFIFPWGEAFLCYCYASVSVRITTNFGSARVSMIFLASVGPKTYMFSWP